MKERKKKRRIHRDQVSFLEKFFSYPHPLSLSLSLCSYPFSLSIAFLNKKSCFYANHSIVILIPSISNQSVKLICCYMLLLVIVLYQDYQNQKRNPTSVNQPTSARENGTEEKYSIQIFLYITCYHWIFIPATINSYLILQIPHRHKNNIRS